MNMFEEIDKIKNELPKYNTISKQVGKIEFNAYQNIAFALGLFVFVVGIIFGNLFPSCGNTSSYYDCLLVGWILSMSYYLWNGSYYSTP